MSTSPDPAAAYLTHWWSFNGDVNDIKGGAHLYGGSAAPMTKGFSKDRRNRDGSSLYLNLGYYHMPPAVYMYGDYTITFWVKLNSFQPWGALLQLGMTLFFDDTVT